MPAKAAKRADSATGVAAAVQARPPKKGDHVFLVDGSSYIFRAYHALPPLNRKSDGLQVNAVLGFCNMLWKLMRDMKPEERPTHLAVVFDKSETHVPHRNVCRVQGEPDRARPTICVRNLPSSARRCAPSTCRAWSRSGFEADDLIATYVREACEAGATATIVASDKDLMQLVSDCVVMYDTMKDRKIGIPEVIEKFGVPPEKVIEVQALIGDSTDNVPGVPGIGVKTAAQLIGEYGDLETLLARAGEIKQEKRRQALIENAEKARLSKKLVTLDDHVALDVPLAELAVHEPDYKRLIAFLKAMEFSTLTRRVAEFSGIDPAAIEADGQLKAGGGIPVPEGDGGGRSEPGGVKTTQAQQASLPLPPISPHPAGPPPRRRRRSSRRRRSPRPASRPRATPRSIARATRSCAASTGSMPGSRARATSAWSRSIPRPPVLDPMQATLVRLLARGRAQRGLLRSAGPSQRRRRRRRRTVRRPDCARPDRGARGARGIEAAAGRPGRAQGRARPEIRPADFRAARHRARAFRRHHADVLRARCRTLQSRDRRSCRIATSITPRSISARSQARESRASPSTASRSTRPRSTPPSDADIALRLWHVLKPRMAAEHTTTVYETLERPLVPVLARMERRGISIDRQVLSRLSGEFAQRSAALEAEIQTLAGEPLNPGSPKQLGDILFGKLGLPGGTKTKTGQWSTGARVLDDLAEQGHALPRKILDWRQVSKLKSTYTDALPGYVNARTHRVHTSYALAATPTGRLSSSEPNLQNIPIRTEEGRKIRRAFIASAGNKLVSADYSQIELRLLAEIADIAPLKKAFRDGLDIHAMTASEMFGVPIKGMPGDVRRRAKAINFGIIYGISAFGLANQLGIEREEAGAYIKQVFRALSRHPRLHGRDQGLRQEERLRAHAVRPQVPLSRNRALERLDSRLQRARRDQRAAAGHRRRHHPPRHGAHGARRWRRRSSPRRCCCRCTTSWCSRCRRPRSRRRCRWCRR